MMLRQSRESQSRQQGFTILEVLAAVVIVVLALVALTPALVVAAAARIHSERLDNASSLAQQSIDQAQVLISQGKANYTLADIDALAPVRTESDAPAVGVDTRQEGNYFIQTFRFNQVTETVRGETRPVAFTMGVRVFSDQAFNGTTYQGTTNAAELNQGMTSSVSSVEGALLAKELPLLYLTYEIGSVADYRDYCSLLSGSGTGCP